MDSSNEIACFKSLAAIMQACPGIQVVVITTYDYEILEFLLPQFQTIMPSSEMLNGSTIRFKAYGDAEAIRGWESHVLYFPYAYAGEGKKLGRGKAIKQAALFRQRAPGNYPRILMEGPEGWDW